MSDEKEDYQLIVSIELLTPEGLPITHYQGMKTIHDAKTKTMSLVAVEQSGEEILVGQIDLTADTAVAQGAKKIGGQMAQLFQSIMDLKELAQYE